MCSIFGHQPPIFVGAGMRRRRDLPALRRVFATHLPVRGEHGCLWADSLAAGWWASGGDSGACVVAGARREGGSSSPSSFSSSFISFCLPIMWKKIKTHPWWTVIAVVLIAAVVWLVYRQWFAPKPGPNPITAPVTRADNAD